MNVDDVWMAELRKLKSAFLEHDKSGTSASVTALDQVIGEFARYVMVNQGTIRHTKENVELIDQWNAFVKAVGQHLNTKVPLKRLLDAIDAAMGATYSKAQPVSSVTNHYHGTVYENIANSTIFNGSIVDSIISIGGKNGKEVEEALIAVARHIDEKGNKEASELFESFNDELDKEKPRKSVLRTLWNELLAMLPTLKTMTDVVEKIVRIFS